jgi:hypothetical protein
MTLTVLRRRTAFVAAWAALIWERAAALLWPALAFPAAYLVLALVGLWDRVGDPWRAIALVVSVLAFLGFAWRGAVSSRWPRAKDARRRVEIDSNLQGRPFEALDDAPVAADPSSRALWRVHQQRMRESLKNVRARRPHAAFAERDAPALRGVLTLAAIGGVAIAGAAAPGRLLDALALEWLAGGTTRIDVQAWIAPPDYTRKAPIFLRGDSGSYEAPAGSQLVVRVVGARRAPGLRLDDEDGRRHRVAFTEDGPQAHAATAVLDGDSDIHVSGKHWIVRVIPDRAPAAAFAGDPKAGTQQELTFSYLLDDDYGIESAVLRIRPTDQPDAAPLEEALDAPPGARSVEEEASLDLTQHPWAGREVELQLAAVDALGQVGLSTPFVMKLPERVFVDPLARAILEQRTTLFSDNSPYAPAPETGDLTAEDAAAIPPLQTDQTELRIGRAPESVEKARRSLELMLRGGALFEDDPAVHLGLAYAAELLRLAHDRADFADLRDTLWDMALRAEGGDLADAERALREAERALARALARGDSPEEIQRLLEEYQEAVNRYMEALTLEALREGRVLSDFAGGQQQQMGGMGEDQLQQMLQALRDLAETGSNEDARRALQALAEMLRNMQVQLAMGQGGQGQQGQQPQSEMSQALRDALQELADVLGRQREAMDQTQTAQGQQGQQGQNGPQGQQGQGMQNQPGQSPGGQSPGGQQGDVPGQRGLQPGAQGGQQPGDQAGRQPGEPGGRNGGGFAEGQDPEFGPGFNQLLDQQREIREALNQLLQEMEEGQIGGGQNGGASDEALDEAQQLMRDAERAMEQAEGALSDEDAEGALQAQNEALDSLRQGLEQLSRGAQAEERRAAGLDEDNQTERANRDPFGRNAAGSGLDVGNSVRVPEEMERRKAREILDELRRRMGESTRPEEELDYLRRLLERF